MSSATTEFWELPFLDAPELQEGCRCNSCVLSVAGNMQGKFSNLVCLSEKSVHGEQKKKRVLIPVSLSISVICRWIPVDPFQVCIFCDSVIMLGFIPFCICSQNQLHFPCSHLNFKLTCSKKILLFGPMKSFFRNLDKE